MKNKNSEIVYSTHPDFPVEDETPKAAKPVESGSEVLKISLDRKQRAGKSVTLIAGFTGWSDEKIERLAKTLKSTCATGGTVKNRKIEIQGDQRMKIEKILDRSGYKTKRGN